MRPVDKDTTARIERTEADIQRFMRNFERFLRKSLDKILRGLEEGDLNAKNAAIQLGGLYDQLYKEGLGEELKEIDRIYARKLRDVAAEMRQIMPGERFSEPDIEIAKVLIDYDLSKIENKIRVTGDSIKSAVMRQVVGGETFKPAEIQAEYGERLGSQIETEIRTGVSSFHQTMINKKSEEAGIQLFAYIGPLDQITREVCRHILTDNPNNGIYTNEERIALTGKLASYGAKLPVETYGGGYNCRHQWSPISADDAAEYRDLDKTEL